MSGLTHVHMLSATRWVVASRCSANRVTQPDQRRCLQGEASIEKSLEDEEGTAGLKGVQGTQDTGNHGKASKGNEAARYVRGTLLAQYCRTVTSEAGVRGRGGS